VVLDCFYLVLPDVATAGLFGVAVVPTTLTSLKVAVTASCPASPDDTKPTNTAGLTKLIDSLRTNFQFVPSLDEYELTVLPLRSNLTHVPLMAFVPAVMLVMLLVLVSLVVRRRMNETPRASRLTKTVLACCAAGSRLSRSMTPANASVLLDAMPTQAVMVTSPATSFQIAR
jgi:hypothetical protein